MPKTSQPMTTLDGPKFAKLLDRIARDKGYRDRLEANAVFALKEVGVDLDAQTKNLLKGKRLSEVTKLGTQSEMAKFPWVKVITWVVTAVMVITKTPTPEAVSKS